MIANGHVGDVIDRVRAELSRIATERNIKLKGEESDYKVEDGWLYICVSPAQAKIQGLDYVQILDEIQGLLKGDHIDHVSLVPMLTD
ncbi:hypothetical protein BH09SUM1_BH09SUM1_10020 [soil metagenome]